jgi:hypothetical protein
LHGCLFPITRRDFPAAADFAFLFCQLVSEWGDLVLVNNISLRLRLDQKSYQHDNEFPRNMISYSTHQLLLSRNGST